MKKRFGFWAVLLLLLGILCLSLLASVLLGSVQVKVDVIGKIILNNVLKKEVFSPTWSKSSESIIWQLRLPKAFAGMIIGAALSVAGIFMQTLTRNPLAEPYVLGISSGASTGAVISLLIGTLPLIGRVPLSIGAFAGAIIASVLVYVFAATTGGLNITSMILIGVALSAGFSSLTSIIIFLTPNSHVLRSALFWMSGSLSAITWKDFPILVMILGCVILASIYYSKKGDLLLVGEDIARNQGVSIFWTKSGLILSSSLIIALVVSISGIIGFVGLVVPHVGRLIVGSRHKVLIPISICLGGILLLWSDVVARVCFAPEELPIGVVTSLIGGPFFLFLLKRAKVVEG